jgi:hypothetical protein
MTDRDRTVLQVAAVIGAAFGGVTGYLIAYLAGSGGWPKILLWALIGAVVFAGCFIVSGRFVRECASPPVDLVDRGRSRGHEIPKNQVATMTRVLLVGYDPDTVDFSNPALPPGMSGEKIRAGVALAVKQMTDRGWDADICYIAPDRTAGETVERNLASSNYACVVIGAGVRLPPQSLAVFEAVVNAVHRAAPAAVIAFNTRPEDSADAAARWLLPG